MTTHLQFLHNKHSELLNANHNIRVLNRYGNPCHSVEVGKEELTKLLGHEPPKARHYRIEFVHTIEESVKLEALYNNEV